MVHTCNPNAAGTLQPFLPMELTEKSSTHTLEFEYKIPDMGGYHRKNKHWNAIFNIHSVIRFIAFVKAYKQTMQQHPNNERLMASENLRHIHAMWQLTAWFALANIDVCFM
jgi:hypothetical protein